MRDADTPAPTQSTRPTRPSEETARLGDEVYERNIRPRVDATHYGVEAGASPRRRRR